MLASKSSNARLYKQHIIVWVCPCNIVCTIVFSIIVFNHGLFLSSKSHFCFTRRKKINKTSYEYQNIDKNSNSFFIENSLLQDKFWSLG